MYGNSMSMPLVAPAILLMPILRSNYENFITPLKLLTSSEIREKTNSEKTSLSFWQKKLTRGASKPV